MVQKLGEGCGAVQELGEGSEPTQKLGETIFPLVPCLSTGFFAGKGRKVGEGLGRRLFRGFQPASNVEN